MPVIVNWDGSIAQPPSPSKERTNKGGQFSGVRGETTYFPVASAYRQLVPVVGYYKVPNNYADRPDLIADHLYKSTDYWWVVLWSNNIIDPFGRPGAGEMINVIDINTLLSLLQ